MSITSRTCKAQSWYSLKRSEKRKSCIFTLKLQYTNSCYAHGLEVDRQARLFRCTDTTGLVLNETIAYRVMTKLLYCGRCTRNDLFVLNVLN